MLRNTRAIVTASGLMLFLSFYLAGCSQTNKSTEFSNGSVSKLGETPDPFEKLNRKLYRLNVGLDRVLLKPVAKAYKKVTPEVIDSGITNFFLNLEDVGSAVNNLLQLKVGNSLIDTDRFIFNSTFGLAGIFDVATEMGLEKHDEDFGQTLAHWGVKSGPYIMLPVFGPSTLRDATAKFSVDRITDLTTYSDHGVPLFVVENLDKRADLLSTEEAFEDISDDKYLALKDAWLQKRKYKINDGKTDEKSSSDLIDELESLDDE